MISSKIFIFGLLTVLVLSQNDFGALNQANGYDISYIARPNGLNIAAIPPNGEPIQYRFDSLKFDNQQQLDNFAKSFSSQIKDPTKIDFKQAQTVYYQNGGPKEFNKFSGTDQFLNDWQNIYSKNVYPIEEVSMPTPVNSQQSVSNNQYSSNMNSNQYTNVNQYSNPNANQYDNQYNNQYNNQYDNQYNNQYGNQYSNQYNNQFSNVNVPQYPQVNLWEAQQAVANAPSYEYKTWKIGDVPNYYGGSYNSGGYQQSYAPSYTNSPYYSQQNSYGYGYNPYQGFQPSSPYNSYSSPYNSYNSPSNSYYASSSYGYGNGYSYYGY